MLIRLIQSLYEQKEISIINGTSGTVGIECLKQLVKIPALEVTVFDKKTKASVKKLSPFQDQVKLVYGDITNLKQLPIKMWLYI